MRYLHKFLIVFFVNTGFALANDWHSCLSSTSDKFQIDKSILLAIAQVESNFNSCAVATNKDGSEDLGLMQINSWWLSKLENYGITKEELLSNSCLNLQAGAWILRQNFDDFGFTWKAIGVYNAGTSRNSEIEKRRQIYAYKVFNALNDTNVINSRLHDKPSCY